MAVPALPSVDAMAGVIADTYGVDPEHARRLAIRQLNSLHERGWEVDRSLAGMRADSLAECEREAAAAEADGDHVEADWFRAEARKLSTHTHQEAA